MNTSPGQIRRFVAGAFIAIVGAGAAPAADKKPNIVIIWGDDVGQSDVSAYSMGLMGFRTPTLIESPGRA